MHVSSLDNMRRCLKRHVLGDPALTAKSPLKVLDIGGADVNGSYRSLFQFTQCDYTSSDVNPGPSVDVTLDGSCELPFGDGSFDVVVSGQTFEHVGPFWKLFSEMARVCADDGVMVVIAPSTGFVHRYPVDCYRFLPDSYQVLADEHEMLLVDHWLDPRGPFQDLVGVFRRRAAINSTIEVPAYLPTVDGLLQNTAPTDELPEHELNSGKMPAVKFLQAVHAAVQPSFYFEIGVFDGVSLHQANCPAIGIDPDPRNRFTLKPEQSIHVGLSSDFFHDEECLATLGPLDLVYIDGMHLIENAYEDFINVERHAHACSVVLIDDIYPNHPQQALRNRSSRHWTGDVWKIIEIFRLARPDLIMLPVDISPTGCLVVLGADPADRSLWNGFDSVLSEAIERAGDPPAEILQRQRALDPDDPLLWRALRTMRTLREVEDPTSGLEQLRRLIHGAMPRAVAGPR
jgi:SAM-dependent methyltransferase